MTKKRIIPNGPPVDMSEFTLGEKYTSEDMYRDHPDLKRGDRVAFEKDGIVYTDTISAVSYSSPEPAIWPELTWRQRLGRRRMLRWITPASWRKPIEPIRPYKPATVTVSTGDDPDAGKRAQAQLGKTLEWIKSMEQGWRP